MNQQSNLAASVRQRLKNLATLQGEDFQSLAEKAELKALGALADRNERKM